MTLEEMINYIDNINPILIDHYVYKDKNYWTVRLLDENRQSTHSYEISEPTFKKAITKAYLVLREVYAQ